MENEQMHVEGTTQPKEEKKKEITIKINRGMIMSVVLVVLIVVSIFQAVQLAGLKGKIASGAIKAASASTSSDGGSVPANLQNLPNMVGGC